MYHLRDRATGKEKMTERSLMFTARRLYKNEKLENATFKQLIISK